MYIYSYNIFVLKILPLPAGYFASFQNQRLCQPPKEEIKTHKETFIFKPFFR